MRRKIVTEATRLPYSNELTVGSLPLDKAEQLIVYSMLAYFDPRFPKEEIPVDIRNIARLTNKRLSNLKISLANAVASLPKRVFYRIDITKKRRTGELFSFEGIPLYQKISFIEEADLVLGIFNEELIPFLILNPDTPIYRLTMLFDFKSQYSSLVLIKLVRQYLTKQKQSPIFVSTSDMIFSVLGSREQSDRPSLFTVSAFNQTVLSKAIRDINNHTKCPIHIEYEQIEGQSKRGNRPLVGYNWYIQEKPGQSIETLIDRIDMTDDLIKRGFPYSLAQKITQEYSWNTIRRNIAYFDVTVKKEDKTPEQLGKILYKFIKQDYEKKNRKQLTIVSSDIKNQAVIPF